jgi:CRP/FNR family transcriptional regulator, cyclic AMP receptor protein
MPRDTQKGDASRTFVRQALRKARLFAAWPEPALGVLCEAARIQTCSPGECVLRRGERAQTLRVVVAGGLEASRTWADGRRAVFVLALSGDLVDPAAIFDDEPAQFDLTARGAATFVAVPHRALRDLVERQAGLSLSLIQALSLKARADAERLQAGLVNSPRVRLAKTLIGLGAERHGRGEAQLAITQDDLAAMLGLSRQSVVSALRPLVRDGILEVGYRSVRLVDRPRLLAVAHEEEGEPPAAAAPGG